MGQNLRVVGWLRFANKAQLNKGLDAFSALAAPEYYRRESWEIEGLDAHIRLDVELPGDFDDVERPFTEMARHAAFGYVDYFEQGNDRITPNALPGSTVKRWVVKWIDKKRPEVDPRGTSGVHLEPAAGPFGRPLHLKGSFTFDDADKLAQAARETFRLPFLTREGVHEIRLGAGVFAPSAKAVSIDVAVSAPIWTISEPLIEVLRAVSAKAVKGSVSLTSDSSIKHVVEAGGKLQTTSGKKSPPPPAGTPIVSFVAASSPLG